MGMNDTREQLDACKAQSVTDEREIAELRATIEGLARQNAELEHDLARAESALADRLQHDAHAHRIGERVDGILLTSEEAALTVRACRHSAESIRAVLDVDPTRLHPDVAGYVQRLQDLADRLQAAAA